MNFLPTVSILTSVYKGEIYLESFFENLVGQTIFSSLNLVLILNNPSLREKELAENFSGTHRDQVVILEVNSVENLGASWNRAWVAARAPYLAVWNIDDRRTPNSLATQVALLKQNPDWQICYGDYVSVTKYGIERGVRRITPKYSVRRFRRSFAQGGAFWVFRRDMADRIGYFDEQFRVGPDMELSFRVAAKDLQMGRSDQLLGFFTDEGKGLSTQDAGQLSSFEKTLIQLRYGVFDKVRPELINAENFKLESVKAFGVWHDLREYLPGYETFLRQRGPLRIIGVIRNGLRSLFSKLGVLKLLYQLQKIFWKQEI